MQNRPTRRRAMRATIALAAAMLVTATAVAHPDERIVDATLTLAPGEVISIPMALHFHRLVATYRVHDAADHGVTLLVVPEPATTPDRRAHPDEVQAFEVALRGEGRINHLIACCLDATYSDFRFELRHDGDEPVTLELRAWAVHDEFAVVARRAEPGALEVPLAIFLLLGVTATLTSTRGVRRWQDEHAASAQRAGGGGVLLAWSVGLLVWACAVAAALGAFGAMRYGTGPVDGLIAAMADLPVPGGPFGSRAALIMGLLLLAWTGSIALWIGAVRRGAHVRSSAAVRVGQVLALTSLATGVAMAWTYGAWSVPLGLALVLAVPLWTSATRLGGARARAAA